MLFFKGIRIDSACKSLPFNGIQRVIFATGWNNTAMSDTLMFSPATQKWINIDSSVPGNYPVPYPIRSSFIVEEQGRGILIGGVTCNSQTRKCTQSDKGICG